MVRARTTGRGARRGAAASGSQRASAGEVIGDGDGNESTTTAHTTATPATLREAVASAPTAVSHSRERTTAATTVTRATTAGRLRPKVVRRDEAGRDQLARQEEKKAMDRAAAERRARGRSRTRSRRSRGDAMGARGGRGISTASGPFSSGLAASGMHRTPGKKPCTPRGIVNTYRFEQQAEAEVVFGSAVLVAAEAAAAAALRGDPAAERQGRAPKAKLLAKPTYECEKQESTQTNFTSCHQRTNSTAKTKR